MDTLRHLTVGVDFSPEGDALSLGSVRALKIALSLATHDDARVDVVFATEGERYRESLEGDFVIVHEGMPPGGEALLEAALEPFVEAEVAAQLRVVETRPWIGLIQDAVEHQADLIVVGKHDQEEQSTALGNVATKLLRKSPLPVLVVGPSTAPAPRRILAATDLGPTGDRALAAACDLARHFASELGVVHAFQLPMSEELAHGHEDPATRTRLADEARARIQSFLTAREIPHASLFVGCTTPVQGILVAVETFAPDILVLGTLGRAGLPGLLVGNTAEKVLPRVSCSILAVKPEGFVSPVATGRVP